MGAYLQLVTPGIPLLGAWVYAGPYAVPNYSVEFGSVHEHDADRRVPQRRPAGGDLRDRADHGRVCGRDRDRQAGAPTEELHQGVPGDHGLGPDRRREELRGFARQALEVLDLDSIRAEQAKRRENGSSKQLGVGFSTYNEMCGLAPSRILGAVRYAAGGWERATIRYLPTGSVRVITGTSPHGQSHETAWAQIVADQLGCDIDAVEVLHGDVDLAQRPRHVWQPEPAGRRGRAVLRRREGDRQGTADRRPPARGLDGRPRVRTRTFTVKGSPDKEMTLAATAWAAFAAHDLRTGWSRASGYGGLRPAELLVAIRRRGSRGGRHRDG